MFVTVPQLVNEPSSAGGTGSLGLTVFSALVGGSLGFAMGVATGATAYLVYVLVSYLRASAAVRTLLPALTGSATAFAVFGSFARWATGRALIESVTVSVAAFVILATGAAWLLSRGASS
ncbi:hypothetical protein [Luethyella okanaganae]|uniref:Membrane transporter protein n=1 Tax=Luethyella okanaganae TaxID=69372 RepID=A0ABW1VCS3_9MICO